MKGKAGLLVHAVWRVTAVAMGLLVSRVDGEIAVPAEETVVVDVAGSETAVRPAVEGVLRKEGAAALALDDADLPNGVIEVREGALRLVSTNRTPETAALPAWAAQSAALWFDATTNVITGVGSNGVVQWLDARETDQAAPYVYPRAVQHESDPVPLLISSDAVLHGQAYLSFGGYGSGRWLKWVSPDDSRLAVTNILNVFIVFGRQPGYGFLLGDWDWTQAGNVGRMDFHIGDSGSNGMNCAFWSLANTAATVRYGSTLVNKTLVSDVYRDYTNPGYQLLEVKAEGDAYASNFCNDRNYKAGGEVPIDRQGGPRYCEALLFTNRLSVSQRAEIADYLTAKWLNRETRAGRVDALSETRSEAEAGAGRTLAVKALGGEGLLVKQGEGTLLFDRDTDLFRGAVRLEAGAVESRLQRADLAFTVETGGQMLTVTSGSVRRASLGEAGLFRKTGTGTLTLGAVSNAVAQIEASEGTLRLSAPFAATTSVLRVAITNSGFEGHDAVSANDGKYQTGLAPTGWTIITDGANGKGGITLDFADTPWVLAGSIPEGGSAVYFQYSGGIKTTVQIPRGGIYRLSFWGAGRRDNATYRQHDFGVWLGSQQVAVAKTYAAGFERFECVTPYLTNGTYELRFQGIVSSVNRASVIDDVRLELLDGGISAGLKNGGFEYSEHFGSATGTDSYKTAPAGADWVFDPTSGNNMSGITEMSRPGTAPVYGILARRQTPEGRRCAFMRSQGAFRQTFAFPSTGEVYRLSFRVAASEFKEDHAFRVVFDGVPVIPYMQSAHASFRLCEVTLPTVTNGTGTLEFAGLSSDTKDTLFDDVRIFRADDVALPNGGFEETTSLSEGDYTSYTTVCEGAGWVFEQDADLRKPGISGRHASFGLPYQGGRMAFLQGKSVIRQSVTLHSKGTHVISFYTAGRLNPWRGHAFEVCWQGKRLGVVETSDSGYRRYSFRLPCVADETSGEIMFRGLTSGTVSSLLDNVMIERLPVLAAAALLPEKAVLSVAQGALLDLDFEGTLPVSGVTLGGQMKSRTISADTYPEFITGTGALYTPAKGTLIRVK